MYLTEIFAILRVHHSAISNCVFIKYVEPIPIFNSFLDSFQLFQCNKFFNLYQYNQGYFSDIFFVAIILPHLFLKHPFRMHYSLVLENIPFFEFITLLNFVILLVFKKICKQFCYLPSKKFVCKIYSWVFDLECHSETSVKVELVMFGFILMNLEN